MMKDDRPFYAALVNNPELLLQVIEILKASPTLVELSNLLFEIGIFRRDGRPYGKDRVGRIKRIAKQLNDGVEIDE